MNPFSTTRHHRRPRWVASGAFWAVLMLADLAILSFWAAVGTLVLAVGAAGGVALRRRRLVGSASAPVVLGPSGAPVEIAMTTPPPTPAGPPEGEEGDQPI